MPASNKLTEAAVKKAKPKSKAYKLSDGEGMYLEVTSSGSKYWRLKYRFSGKEKRLALGVYPVVSLAEAREKRREAKLAISQGKDPSELKKQAKYNEQLASANTFESIAIEFLEKRRKEGAAETTISKIDWILRKKLYPYIGNLAVSELTPQRLLEVLRRIEKDGIHETANRARRIAGQIMRYAVATGRAERDISQDLQGALVTPKVKHMAAIIDPKEFGILVAAIDDYEGSPEVKAALKLSALLFQRPGEIRHMEWSEIDWEQERWEIPAKKMKMRESHVVPLCSQALEILTKLQPITGFGRYVFPSARKGDRPLSENGVRVALRTLGYTNDQMTPHGFRASARTILDEILNFRVDWIEQQLAHAVKDANGRAYNRTKYLKERKQMMQAWADYLDELKQKTS